MNGLDLFTGTGFLCCIDFCCMFVCDQTIIFADVPEMGWVGGAVHVRDPTYGSKADAI